MVHHQRQKLLLLKLVLKQVIIRIKVREEASANAYFLDGLESPALRLSGADSSQNIITDLINLIHQTVHTH